MMKAVRLHAPMDFRVDDIPMPEIGPGQVKIRTEYCGICGSDVPRALYGSVPFFSNTLGHEFCATVTEIGEGVTSVVPGDLVQVMPLIVCHQCEHCKNGNFGECLHKRFIGLRVPDAGAFAEYNVMPESNVIKLPDGMDPVKAAFVEPVSVALHGLNRLQFQPGKDLAVIGAGTIGELSIKCAKLQGAKHIYVFDVDDEKLEHARQIGADYCYNTAAEGFMEQYWADTDGLGIDQVLEICGLEQTILLAVDICKACGRIALVGLLGKSVTLSSEHLRRISEMQLTITGVWQSYDLNYPGRDWRLAIHYVANDLINVMDMLYKVDRFENANAVFAEYQTPGKVKGKIVLTFHDT